MIKMTEPPPAIQLLVSPVWDDYELLDSGEGAKLERYGPYRFIRPEHQAVWQRNLPSSEWEAAHATFQPTGEESGGRWQFKKPVTPEWEMTYRGLRFKAHAVGSRHMGVFPEQASHWDWIAAQIKAAREPVKVLNLFGYTGLATLAAARAGAQVTHVDASKKSVTMAHENQLLSGLQSKPVRWIVDDAVKFVRREARRNSRYAGILLDPPKFGRGPKGEIWEVFQMLPSLLRDCREILQPGPVFVVITAYAIRASALSLYYALQEMMEGFGGQVEAGELAIAERSAGRLLSTAIFTRWSVPINSPAGKNEQQANNIGEMG